MPYHKQLYSGIVLWIMLLSLLFTIGCIRTTSPNQQPVTTDYHKGTDGLVMNFVSGNPPDEVRKGSDFTILLEVKNKGAYPISDGDIRLLGIDDPYYFESEQNSAVINLEGRSVEYPEGGYDLLPFNFKSINAPGGSKTYPATVTVLASYSYGTEATAQVCITPDWYSIKKEGCEVKEVVLSEGQGAPVAVTKVEEFPSYAGFESELIEVVFKISIANKGEGDISGDTIKVDEVKLGDKKLVCVVDSPFKLKKDEERSFSCSTIMERPRGAYVSPLVIRISYGYLQKISKQFSITSMLRG